MRAVRLFAPGDIRCVEHLCPDILNADDVIINVKACGVCGSDIMRVMKKGTYTYPITVGHEFSGEVVEVGKQAGTVQPGDRVTVMPLIHCCTCDYCRIGEYVLCDDYDYYGSRVDGAMAEYARVSARNVLLMPNGLDYEAAAMTDPIAVALHAVRKASLLPGQCAAVFGLGAIGLVAVQWLKIMGAGEVIAVDIYSEKLQLAKELGADVVVNGKKQDVAAAIKEATGGKGADAAIEIAGSKISQVQAIRAVRKMGTVVYCGISYDDLLIPNAELSDILRGELVLKGTWNSSMAPLPINEWEVSLQMVASGRIKARPVISHRFKLEQCQGCFDMMYHRTEVFNKVMFIP